MTEPEDKSALALRSPYTEPKTYTYLLILTLVLAAITWLAIRIDEGNLVRTWLGVLVLLTIFVVIVGRAMTGHWRGVLIDSRNRLSLSRLQILAWMILILASLLAAAMSNVRFGWDAALNIEVPAELWIVLGISTASWAAAPALLNTKRDARPDPSEVERTKNQLTRQGYGDVAANLREVGLLVRNERTDAARWADLFKGEEAGDAATVDLGKLQMFFFTFILVLGYGAAIGTQFAEGGTIAALPPIDDGMYILLGISHTGYLANKTVTHTQTAALAAP